jgi:putative transposase
MAHTYTNLLIHALFSTKDRQPIIHPEMKSDLYAYMGGIITSVRGKPLLINGPKDHVHLLCALPSTLSLADFMEKLKANSSKWVDECSGRRVFSWQTGYAAFSVSPTFAVENYFE